MSIDENILFFLIIWIVIFLCDYFLILRNKLYNILNNNGKNKRKKKVEIIEVTYLSYKFKINKQNLYKKSIVLWMAFLNSFIISLVSTVISLIPLAIGWQLIIGFVLLFGLIYAIYEIYGRILVKEGY